MAIHPTAIIDKNVEMGNNNEIGPYVVIERGVRLGNENKIGPGTIITGNTIIGNRNQIHGHVYIGNTPQDLSYNDEVTNVKIGDNNTIREFATIHRGTKEGSTTVIGDYNYLMVASHVAHNCKLGNNIIMVNGASLGGYVEVYDHTFLSAFVIIHQFTRIGSYSICGILTKITKDIPPFMMIDGNPAAVRGINLVGLKRKGFSPERRSIIKKAYKVLYRSGNSINRSLEELRKLQKDEKEMSHKNGRESLPDDLQVLIDFIENSNRGIILRSSKDIQNSLSFNLFNNSSMNLLKG